MSLNAGTYGVVLTPFDRDGNMNEEMLRKELRYCVNTEATGLVLCGSTGEFVYMDIEQQKTVLRIGTEEIGAAKTIIGGASAATEKKVIDILEYMNELGIKYALIGPPYYYPQNSKDVVSFYETISKNAPEGMEIILYNIPFCSSEISLESIKQLLEFPNITGLKDSSGNMMYFVKLMNLVKEVRPDFQVFTGQDCLLMPSLTAGAAGGMSALAWMADGAISKIFKDYHCGDAKAASELQAKVTKLICCLDEIAFPENYKVLSDVAGTEIGDSQRRLHNLNDAFISAWRLKAAKLLNDLKISAS